MSISVRVRYFAAAADAAGRDEETLTLPAPSSVGDVKDQAAAAHGAELARVLDLCSFLLNGQASEADAPLAAGADGEVRLDVLPPFAGG